MITGYSFRFAFESLIKEFWINLMASLSTGMGLFLIAVISLGFYNINLLTERLPEKFTVVIYMKEKVSRNDIDRLMAELRNNTMVKSIKFIPKEIALEELKKRFPEPGLIGEGLDENPLPDSIELKLKSEYMKADEIKAFITHLKSISFIDDIDYGEEMMASVMLVKRAVETAGLILTVLILTGVIFNFYTTIKILFYRKREEVETFKLLGAEASFIRAPFLIEGAIIGIAGGLFASILMLGLYQIIVFMSSGLPFIRSIPLQQLLLLSSTQVFSLFLILPVTGGFLGIIGSFIGLGRIRY